MIRAVGAVIAVGAVAVGDAGGLVVLLFVLEGGVPEGRDVRELGDRPVAVREPLLLEDELLGVGEEAVGFGFFQIF